MNLPHKHPTPGDMMNQGPSGQLPSGHRGQFSHEELTAHDRMLTPVLRRPRPPPAGFGHEALPLLSELCHPQVCSACEHDVCTDVHKRTDPPSGEPQIQ